MVTEPLFGVPHFFLPDSYPTNSRSKLFTIAYSFR